MCLADLAAKFGLSAAQLAPRFAALLGRERQRISEASPYEFVALPYPAGYFSSYTACEWYVGLPLQPFTSPEDASSHPRERKLLAIGEEREELPFARAPSERTFEVVFVSEVAAQAFVAALNRGLKDVATMMSFSSRLELLLHSELEGQTG
jgi:hypothetical protein